MSVARITPLVISTTTDALYPSNAFEWLFSPPGSPPEGPAGWTLKPRFVTNEPDALTGGEEQTVLDPVEVVSEE